MATMKEIYFELSTVLKNNTAKNKGISGVFQFDISGEDAMSFSAKLEDGSSTLNEGEADSPTITISMDSNDFKDMVAGKLNGTMAFMSGKLKIKGDMALALKLDYIIRA